MRWPRRRTPHPAPRGIAYQAVNAETALVLDELRELTEQLRTTAARLQQEEGDV